MTNYDLSCCFHNFIKPSVGLTQRGSNYFPIPASSHTLLSYVHRQQGGGGAASTSSLAGSDNPAVGGLKSRARIQGSSDSGFIGSEEGKSPNTPSDR